MSSTLYRLGQWSFVHRRRVAAIWLLVLLAVGAAAATLSRGTSNEFTIPGTESTVALNQLSHTFPQVSGSNARLIVVAPDGVSAQSDAVRTPIEAFVSTAEAVDHVEAVADPYGSTVSGAISADSSAVIVSIQLDGQSTTIPASTSDALVKAKDTLAAALPAGSQVSLGGDLFTISVPTISATEGIGVLVALVVLLFTFGSLLAAGMPLLNALLGVAITMAGIYAATRFATISSTTPLLALMLGLAVGIDYALFIVSRHQGQLRSGMDPRESAARSLATAGSAVVFAGLTVMIALVGLAVARIPFLTIMGVAAAVGVGIAVLVALTLTPALLGFVGERIRPGRRAERRAARRAARGAHSPATSRAAAPAAHTAPAAAPSATAPSDGEEDVHPNRFFSAWIKASTRWPVVTILVIVVGLGALALPARDLRLALPDAGTQPAGSPARVTYDLVAEHFGPGYNGPLMVTGSIVGSTDPLGLMANLKKEIAALPGVAAVPLATPNQDATMGVIQVIPTGAPDSTETSNLVHAIRAQHDHFQSVYGVDLSVTGLTAVQIDISAKLGAALVPFGIFVVGLSFLLLMMVFRSLWVPLKATAGYLLSIVSAFGVVSLVFQHGIGASLLGVDRTPQAVLSFMPIVAMGVLFGLAMDYEVFLVSRMREEYVHRGDAHRAVRVGFLSSAKVVTAAAIIMFSVFLAFVPGHDTMIKPIALGLTAGIFIDAFIVRMTLVPAVLQLLGERAWHMPRLLDRVLPHFDVEGEGLADELRLADWPEPGADDAIVAQGLRLDAPDGMALYRDIDVRVPRGGTLVVTGPHRSGRTPLLLTLAGRAHADAGTLKVNGLVASVRARDIRHSVAFARLARTADPVGELDEAFATGAPVVVIDDLDAVGDPWLRQAVHDRIARARRDDPQRTLVVSVLDEHELDDLLPPGPRTVVGPMHQEVLA